MQLGQELIQQVRQQGQSFTEVNGDGMDDRLQDPNFLAQKTTQVHQQQPGLLGQLLGGASGGTQPVKERPRAGGGMSGMLSIAVILGGWHDVWTKAYLEALR